MILFLVEGQNDEYALIPPFKKLIAGEARAFSQAFHCDVTVAHIFRSESKLTLGRDVCDTVRRFILDRLTRRPGYQWDDIAKIVHIVDTDGAFVPADAVIEDESALGIEYGLDCIRCHNRNWVVQRNAVKSESLDMLVGKRVLRYKNHPVPYSVSTSRGISSMHCSESDGSCRMAKRATWRNVFAGGMRKMLKDSSNC